MSELSSSQSRTQEKEKMRNQEMKHNDNINSQSNPREVLLNIFN